MNSSSTFNIYYYRILIVQIKLLDTIHKDKLTIKLWVSSVFS